MGAPTQGAALSASAPAVTFEPVDADRRTWALPGAHLAPADVTDLLHAHLASVGHISTFHPLEPCDVSCDHRVGHLSPAPDGHSPASFVADPDGLPVTLVTQPW